MVIRLRRRRPEAGRVSSAVRRGLAWPLQRAGQLAHVLLSKAMLLSCEVALEYMLGLSYSPQVGHCWACDPVAGCARRCQGSGNARAHLCLTRPLCWCQMG